MQLSGISAENNNQRESRIKVQIKSEVGDSKIRRNSRASQLIKSSSKMSKSKHRKSAQLKSQKKSFLHFKSFEKPLKSVESKIFQEVVCLINEISQIEGQIRKQASLITIMAQQKAGYANKEHKQTQISKDIKLLIQRSEVMDEKKYGITLRQLEDIESECKKIEESIDRLQLRQEKNLQEIISTQQTEHQNLLRILQNLKQNSAQNAEDLTGIGKTQKLEQKINAFLVQNQQNNQKQAASYYLKEVESIRGQILSISQTKIYDKETSEQKQERERLEAYIREQNTNKILFLEDLSNFKSEYEQLLGQNEQLKRRINNLQR